MKLINKIFHALLVLCSLTAHASTSEKKLQAQVLEVLKNIDTNPTLDFDYKSVKKACKFAHNPKILQRLLSIQYKTLFYCLQRISLHDEDDFNSIPDLFCENPVMLQHVEEYKLNLSATLLWALGTINNHSLKDLRAHQKHIKLGLWAFFLINDFVMTPFEQIFPSETALLSHSLFDDQKVNVLCNAQYETMSAALQGDSLFKELLKKNFYGLRKLLPLIPQNIRTSREHAYLYYIFSNEYTNSILSNLIIHKDLYDQLSPLSFDPKLRLQEKTIMDETYEEYNLYENHNWPEDFITPVIVRQEDTSLPATKLKSVGTLLNYY